MENQEEISKADDNLISREVKFWSHVKFLNTGISQKDFRRREFYESSSLSPDDVICDYYRMNSDDDE